MEHFLPCKLPLNSDGRMWNMIRCGQEVRSHTDYILGMDCHLFQNMAVWDYRHNTNHYLVLGCLHIVTLR